MITVPGLTVTTVVDQIYDTSAGTDVVVSATGTTTPLLTGALIPIGIRTMAARCWIPRAAICVGS